MMTLMTTPMVMKHTVIIPTVVISDNPVDEKIQNAWSQVGYTHIGTVSEINAEEAKV